LALPERHRLARPERRCSEGFRDAAAALRPEVQSPQVARIACPAAALLALWEEAARPAVLVAVRCPARPSVVVAPKVRARRRAESAAQARQLAEPTARAQLVGPRPAEPAGWAEAAAEVPREEAVPQALAVRSKAVPAARDVAAGPQPVVALAAVGLLPEAAAGLDAAVAVQPQGAVRAAVAAVRLPGAVPVAEVRRRVAPGAQGVLPSAPAWAAALSIRFRGDRPAPSRQARSAHAKISSRIAQP
jgi:hypothetical protein